MHSLAAIREVISRIQSNNQGQVTKLTSLTISHLVLEAIWDLFYSMLVSEKLLYVKADHVRFMSIFFFICSTYIPDLDHVKLYSNVRCLDIEYLDFTQTYITYLGDFEVHLCSTLLTRNQNFFKHTQFLKVKTLNISGTIGYRAYTTALLRCK